MKLYGELLAADGGSRLLRIAWGVGMATGAVLAEPGSAGLSTGESCAVVVSTPEGGESVVDPMRRSDGASGRHAGRAGRIAGGFGVAGAAVAMVLVSHLLGAFAGSDPPSRTGRGNDPARGETLLAVRAAYALDHEGQGRQAGGAGSSPDGAGRSASVHPGLALAVAGRGCGRGGSAGGGMPGTVSGVARMQFRPGVPQPRQPTATGRGAGAHVALPAKGRGTEASRAREGTASFVARRQRYPGVESARSMPWKVMAWTGYARMAGQASNAPWVSRSSPPTGTGSDAYCSNGRRGGPIARTHHPIV